MAVIRSRMPPCAMNRASARSITARSMLSSWAIRVSIMLAITQAGLSRQHSTTSAGSSWVFRCAGGARVGEFPDFKGVLAQVVPVVFGELLKRGFGHPGEFDLCRSGHGCGAGAFHYVLLAAACGLAHLVYGAAVACHEASQEHLGEVTDYHGFSVDVPVLVVSCVANDG